MIDVNLKSPQRKRDANLYRSKHGHIITTSSVAGLKIMLVPSIRGYKVAVRNAMEVTDGKC